MTFDWSFVQRYAPFFVNGTLMTLFISVFGILLAIAVGLVCAGVEIARIPVARQIVRIYIELSRNTPLLVQLYFLPDVYLEVQHPCWSCNSNSSSANASAGVR